MDGSRQRPVPGCVAAWDMQVERARTAAARPSEHAIAEEGGVPGARRGGRADGRDVVCLIPVAVGHRIRASTPLLETRDRDRPAGPAPAEGPLRCQG